MSDEMNVIRSNRPEPAPNADALADQRSEFMNFLDQQPKPKRRRAATVAMTIAGVTAVGLPAAAAINSLSGGASAATEFTCELPEPVDSERDGYTETEVGLTISPVTGDPVADCAAALSENGIDVGVGAQAYETENGIVVVPNGVDPDSSYVDQIEGATPLEDGVATEPDVGAAMQRVLDVADIDECTSGAEMRSALESALAAEGFDGWSVTGGSTLTDGRFVPVDVDGIDGRFSCASAPDQPNYADKQIELSFFAGSGPGSFQSEIFTDGECVGISEAEQRLPGLIDGLDSDIDWSIVLYANDSGPVEAGAGWPDVDGFCVEVIASPETGEIVVLGPHGEA